MAEIKVLVVEDSLVFRNLLVNYINKVPELKVVAEANDPYEARDMIIKHNPDVMTLDIELPRMDGIEFLRKLMPQYPVRTVVISALSDRVFDALNVGAVDFVAKPISTDKQGLNEFLTHELPEKILAASRAKLWGSPVGKRLPQEKQIDGRVQEILYKKDAQEGMETDIVVAIGASTGGTEATASIIESLVPPIPPIVITQHMPEGFTKMYADRMHHKSHQGITVEEASQNAKLLPNHVYIAPGGNRHMVVTKKGGEYRISLKEGEKVNGHKPSVEVLFDSMAQAVGNRGIGIILTGMGGDGAKGLLHMRQRGARTIGQDESTCVVYGMPKVAYELGAVESQEKLGEIPQKLYYYIEQQKKQNKKDKAETN